MDKLNELLKFLTSDQNVISTMIFILVTALFIFLVAPTPVMPNFVTQKVEQYIKLCDDYKADVAKRDDLLAQKKTKDEQEKLEKDKKVDVVPIKIYEPENKTLPIESSSIEFVSSVIKKISATQNTIADISYEVKSAPASVVPANVAVIELVVSMTGTYMAFQDFVYELYGEEFVTAIKSIKMVPLKENKNLLETNMILELYVSK